MATFSIPFAIFTLFIVVADIIMALTLCFSLPFHASRLHFYPPYGRIVDIDTATIHCPCLNKYLEEFRGKLDVKFVRPPKHSLNGTGTDTGFVKAKGMIKKKKVSTAVSTAVFSTVSSTVPPYSVNIYPYVASVATHNMTCEGIVSTVGSIIISGQCASEMGNLVNAKVRTRSNYLTKYGSVYTVKDSKREMGFGGLMKMYVFPPIPKRETIKSLTVEEKLKVPEDDILLVLHSWTMRGNKTTEVFDSVFFRRFDGCHITKHTHFCVPSNEEVISRRERIVVDHCNKKLAGIVLEDLDSGVVGRIGSNRNCFKIYEASCLDEEDRKNFCSKTKKDL